MESRLQRLITAVNAELVVFRSNTVDLSEVLILPMTSRHPVSRFCQVAQGQI